MESPEEGVLLPDSGDEVGILCEHLGAGISARCPLVNVGLQGLLCNMVVEP